MKLGFQLIYKLKANSWIYSDENRNLIKRENKDSEIYSECTCPEGFAKEKR